jgi:hypothetical protein
VWLGKKKSEATEGLGCGHGLPLSSFYRRDSQKGFAYHAVSLFAFPFVRVCNAAQRLRITTDCEKTLILPAIVIVINLMIKIVN